MTLTTTDTSHDHALACRDRPRTVPLPTITGASSRTSAALAECLDAWSRQLSSTAQSLHRDWSRVVRLHRRVGDADHGTAASLWR